MKKNFNLIAFFLILSLLPLSTCRQIQKEMLVTTGSVSNLLTISADVSGTVVDLGDGATQHGHCYATTPNPGFSGTKTELGAPAAGGFTSTLTGLEPGTKYYVKAYLAKGTVVVYGDEINFTTSSAALPTVTSTAATGITKTVAVCGGNVTDQGGTAVTARGVCWSTATNPSVESSKTTDGSGAGVFTSNLSNLTAGTKYYIRAYATNAGGTAYGEELDFTTLPDVSTPPVVTTAEVTAVTINSAVCGGEVTNEGGAPVISRGVCWSTTINPTITNSKTINGASSGSFVSNLTELSGNTTYYVRAYATNSVGTAYGEERSFKTGAVLPVVTTSEVTSVTSTGATGGGDVTSDGGADVTARGVCWSTSQNPTITGSKTTDGTGTGSFVSSLSGLTGNTTYYVRAYATNSVGTAYGNNQSFTTDMAPSINVTAPTGSAHWLAGETNKEITWTSYNVTGNVIITLYKAGILLRAIVSNTANSGSYIWTLPDDLNYGSDYKIRVSSVTNSAIYGESAQFKISEPGGATGTVSDIDGNTYNTVKIGTQWWMAANLKTTMYNDYTSIPLVTDATAWSDLTTPGYCWYENDQSAYGSTYGALYNWFTVNTGKLCPGGWHVPTDAEWITLRDYLIANGYNYDGTTTDGGNKTAKALAATTNWTATTTAGAPGNTDYPAKRNATGFTALPGGYRSIGIGGTFSNIGNNGNWWSSTEESATKAWYRVVYYNGINLVMSTGYSKGYGFSVRCVRNY